MYWKQWQSTSSTSCREQIVVSCSSEEAAALMMSPIQQSKGTAGHQYRCQDRKGRRNITEQEANFQWKTSVWFFSNLWINNRYCAIVLLSVQFLILEFKSLNANEQYKVIVYSQPPPPIPFRPMCHLLGLITAHYHLLHDVHYTAFDTQLKTVSAKRYIVHISATAIFFIWLHDRLYQAMWS